MTPEEAAEQAANLPEEETPQTETPTTDTPPEATETPTPTFDWEQPIEDPELERAFQKKVKLSDLRQRSINAQQKISEQQRAIARAEQEAQTLRQERDILYRQLGQRDQAPQQQPRQRTYQDVGIRDVAGTLVNDPEGYGLGTAQLGARQAIDVLDPRIQNLERQYQQMVQQGQMTQLQYVAEMARARTETPTELWEKRGRFIYSAATVDPRGPFDVNSWIDAAKEAEEVFGAAPQRPQIPQQGIMRANPHGASGTAPVSRAVQQSKPKPRKEYLDLASEAVKFGVKPERVAKIAEEMEEMQQKIEKAR
jgi:hypothetical protein